MTTTILQLQPDQRIDPPRDLPVGRAPYMTVHAFCETGATVASVRKAAADRRLARADVTVSPGGIGAAVRFYGTLGTPDLLVIESLAGADTLLVELEELAAVCDARTRVVVVGGSNDIALYRRLMASGIAEYLVAPIDPVSVMATVLRLFPQDGAARLGKIFAFVGAKGGTGSSTLAQNVAWSMAQDDRKVLLADMDLQFGTAALNYSIDSPVGFAEQLGEADRLDESLIERLLYGRGPNLSVLAGATASHEAVEPAPEVMDRLLDLARATFPLVVLDLPHSWSRWVRQALGSADEVVITATPDLANLRNAQCLMDLLKAARPNDARPRLVLNQIGTPKRAEIGPDQFATSLQVDLAGRLRFEPVLFSAAANNGQMLGEAAKKSAAAKSVEDLARSLVGGAPRPARNGLRFWRR